MKGGKGDDKWIKSVKDDFAWMQTLLTIRTEFGSQEEWVLAITVTPAVFMTWIDSTMRPGAVLPQPVPQSVRIETPIACRVSVKKIGMRTDAPSLLLPVQASKL